MIARDRRAGRSPLRVGRGGRVRLSSRLAQALIVVAFGSCLLGGDNPSYGYLPGDEMAPWEGGPSCYGEWPNGPPSDPGVFPIAVWLQNPSNARGYQAIGINLFVGLWKGPTAEQLSALGSSGMNAFCEQNATGLSDGNRDVIVGWMHQDEPDNAQPDGTGGWNSPMSPSTIVAGYEAMRLADPTRPVYLNLGQGVAWDGWYGRLDRTNHPEDYAEYTRGADIVSFDIYPVNMGDADVRDKLWLVAHGVDRLRKWCRYEKPVWNWIECTLIDSKTGRRPTPAEVKAQVWMSIIHGSMGIGYFVHAMQPFDETALLRDAGMASAVSAINSQIASLARVLNTRSVANGVVVKSSDTLVPVDTMVKRLDGATYIFAVSMRPGTTMASLRARGFDGTRTATVLGEGRAIQAIDGEFEDVFSDYSVHIYVLEH